VSARRPQLRFNGLTTRCTRHGAHDNFNKVATRKAMNAQLFGRSSLLLLACAVLSGTDQPAHASSTYVLGGTVIGLAPGSTVVLRNNGGSDLRLSSNGTFAFGAARLTQPPPRTAAWSLSTRLAT
jgi:hypothetical protein